MTEMTLQPALDAAMKNVLERMFFLEACTCVVPDPFAAGPAVEARLHFAGDPSGALRLRVSSATARSISADFLGVEEYGVTESKIGEVVCEMANMICGAVLSRVENAASFRLGVPEIVAVPQPQVGEPNSTPHSVETASGVFTAILITETSACPAAEKPGC